MLPPNAPNVLMPNCDTLNPIPETIMKHTYRVEFEDRYGQIRFGFVHAASIVQALSEARKLTVLSGTYCGYGIVSIVPVKWVESLLAYMPVEFVDVTWQDSTFMPKIKHAK